MATRHLTPVEILIVEDDETTAMVYRESFLRLATPTNVTLVSNGIEAMACLRREGDYIVNRRPHLILLDLNMPGRGGRELLMEIKRDPDFRAIPVLVISGSDKEEDIAKVYDLGANAFLVKPQPPHTYLQLARQVEIFWLEQARLPD